MLARNVLNRKSLLGPLFSVFYEDDNDVIFFDVDMVDPVIYGSKSLVLKYVKGICSELGYEPSATITINYYMRTDEGWRMKLQYKGLAKDLVVLRA